MVLAPNRLIDLTIGLTLMIRQERVLGQKVKLKHASRARFTSPDVIGRSSRLARSKFGAENSGSKSLALHPNWDEEAHGPSTGCFRGEQCAG